MTMPSVRAIRTVETGNRLVERLIAAGLVSEDQLQRALRARLSKYEALGAILVRLGMISENVLRDTLEDLEGDTRIDLRTALLDPGALAMLPRDVAVRFAMVPIDFDPGTRLLTLAVSGNSEIAAIPEITALLDSGIEIETEVFCEADIKFSVRKFYEYERSLPGIFRELDVDATGTLNGHLDSGDSDHLLKRLVDAILVDAARSNASFIHVELESRFVRVRYRIDGVLRQVMALHRGYWPGIDMRLRSMSGRGVTSEDTATEGRFAVQVGRRRFECRSSWQANRHGDDVILRMMEIDKDPVPLQRLGLADETLNAVRLMVARPSGLIIVAGSEDSGKARTLHAMLDYRNDESVSIVTLEDTARYRHGLIRQSVSTGKADLAQAKRMQSILDQDTDVILVGKMPDKETADRAFAAAADVLVLTAFQASSAIATLTQLVNTGVAPRSIADNLIGIVAQCLLRRLCMNCRQGYAPEKAELELLGTTGVRPQRLYRAGACPECDFLGYRGRIGIFELLKIDDDVADMIARSATNNKIMKAAQESGFRNLADDAVRQVLAGTTSLSEASRVVDLTDRLR